MFIIKPIHINYTIKRLKKKEKYVKIIKKFKKKG